MGAACHRELQLNQPPTRPPNRASRPLELAAVPPRVYLNGKFTAQSTTGVQRVAARLIQALDALLPPKDAGAWVLLCPAGAVPPPLRHIAVRHVGPEKLALHLWEQLVLPYTARDGLLVNLAGAAPYFAARQVCMLHDAAVFDRPRAYTWAFAAWYRLLFRHLARHATRLLTVSAFSQARLALRLGIEPARIGVVRNGCDHLESTVPDQAVLATHGLAGRRYLLAVGSASPNKNLAALVAAYVRLPADPTRRLVIVSGSNERVFAATDVQDPPGVVRIGLVSDAQLASLYRHAAGLVFPSLYEGFGLIPLEAMSLGCPVAAARVAAIPEACGDAALYFEPRSTEAIARAMQRLLGDAALIERLRRAGFARARGLRWIDSATALMAELQPLCRPGPAA